MKRATLNHPKLHALMAEAGISRREALGLLTLLWDFTGEYAMNGAVGRFTDEVIAHACDWPTETAAILVGHLVRSGWLDETGNHPDRLVVHDWKDHCESFVKKRMARLGIEFSQNGRPKRATEVDDQPGSPEWSPFLAQPIQAEPSQAPAVGFSELWAVLWSKIKQAAVIEEANEAVKSGTTWAELIDAAREFAQSPAGKAGKFAPNPDTWLRDERYRDDRVEWWTYGLEGEAKREAAKKYQRRRAIDDRCAELTEVEWGIITTNMRGELSRSGLSLERWPVAVRQDLPRTDPRARAEVFRYLEQTEAAQ